MAQSLKEYERLPGRGGRFEGSRLVAGRRTSSSLWLGPDHLLGIDSAGFTQDYKRFYYRDIQSLLIRKTDNGKIWNWVLLCLALIPLVVAIAGLGASGNRDWLWFGIWGGISFVFWLFLGINSLRGPTCITHLKTAVQLEELPSLVRLRNAEKALERLRVRITEAQGSLAPAEAQAQVETLLQATVHQPTSNFTIAPHYVAAAEPIDRPYQSRAHHILFTMILAEGAVSFLQIFFNSIPTVLASTFLTLGVFGFIVVALIKQFQTDLQPLIKGWTWASAVFYSLQMLVSYISYFVISAGNPEVTQNQWKLMQRFAEISPLEKPWLFGLLAVSGIISVVLGGFGLVALRNFARKRHAFAAAPPVISPVDIPPPVS